MNTDFACPALMLKKLLETLHPCVSGRCQVSRCNAMPVHVWFVGGDSQDPSTGGFVLRDRLAPGPQALSYANDGQFGSNGSPERRAYK